MTLEELAEKHEISRMKITKRDLQELRFEKKGVYYINFHYGIRIHKEDFRKMKREQIQEYLDVVEEVRQNER